ncbi:hemolysin III family protein [Geomonas sp. RF6]|uniref:PAQR family membrane homeostasis protein TrhA n=1 Tax=Geomonas sp. RF6 TaxID=2897342 RepID=UPI001E2B496C|nr:hemolysin III family protein [Geomonas sp. RF6]UFS72168.1 hemolysin III family protein [Geomonas sp. RF6]
MTRKLFPDEPQENKSAEASEDIRDRLVVYTEQEELANSLTHGVGVLFSIVALVVLIMRAASYGDPYRLTSVTVYGVSMLTFYSLSTAYHTVRKPYARYVFRILDHASIYLMIAGSYTPFTLVTLRGPWGWSLFVTVWCIAVLGAILKVFHTHRTPILGPILYIVMGWLVVIALKPLSAALAPTGLKLLFAGGLAYTLGVLVYMWDNLPYNHAIWHVIVLVGSVCHFLSIFYYVTPLPN